MYKKERSNLTRRCSCTCLHWTPGTWKQPNIPSEGSCKMDQDPPLTLSSRDIGQYSALRSYYRPKEASFTMGRAATCRPSTIKLAEEIGGEMQFHNPQICHPGNPRPWIVSYPKSCLEAPLAIDKLEKCHIRVTVLGRVPEQQR